MTYDIFRVLVLYFISKERDTTAFTLPEAIYDFGKLTLPIAGNTSKTDNLARLDIKREMI